LVIEVKFLYKTLIPHPAVPRPRRSSELDRHSALLAGEVGQGREELGIVARVAPPVADALVLVVEAAGARRGQKRVILTTSAYRAKADP
jgi:hypothetical protein